MRRSGSTWLCVATWTCALAGTAAPASQSDAPQPLQEVTVTATRVPDHAALVHAINGFVASHSAPSTRINQLGRWHEPVCPLVTGLQDSGVDRVTREILDVARGVGAPTASAGKKCPVSVEIVFTKQPQVLLDRVARAYPLLLGFYPVYQRKQMTTFSGPVQAWYETGTRSMETQLPIAAMGSPANAADQSLGGGGASNGPPLQSGAQVDSFVTAMGMQPSGTFGSRLTGSRLRSEFVHVLIIADSGQLARYPLNSVADYLAMVSLTRMAQLDQCAPLPSITDLLARGCAQPVADLLTAADRAYLKALYSADLEQRINLERSEVRDQMVRQIEGK